MERASVTPMEVAWLRKALLNLDEEAAYIAQDNPQAAQQVVMRIVQGIELLRNQPGLGRPGRVPGTRELPVAGTRYLIRIACAVSVSKYCAACIRRANRHRSGRRRLEQGRRSYVPKVSMPLEGKVLSEDKTVVDKSKRGLTVKV